MRQTIISDDLYRYVGGDNQRWIVRLRYFFFTPGFRYIYLFRKASASKGLCKAFWTFFMRQCMLRTGIQIPVGTQIDRGLRIVHFGHIVVNPAARIGKNFNICQGCLVGNSLGRKGGVPSIGDNVFMQANSVVVGGVSIGDNVLIAPGAFVNFDVPDNSIVIGNPGNIIERESSPTAKYIVYSV